MNHRSGLVFRAICLLALVAVAAVSAADRKEADAPPEQIPTHLEAVDADRGAAGLAQALQQLQTRASLLMITAHPDDEDGGLLAFESRGQGTRAALMTLNRGEGGQNAMSDDMYDALGLLRTQELLQADRYYGVDQFWGSVIDYGFSKTREEALEKWGHDRVLGEVVRVIRQTRPLILVSVFAGAPTDGHGNHQVAGQMAQEAFVAAGDPKRFPEQMREGLRPWSPLKVYAHVPFFQPTKEGIYDYATDKYVPVRFFDYVHQKWIDHKPSTDLTIPEGTLNAPTGLTYLQLGREGLAYQQTQNHGGMIPLPSLYSSEYHEYGSRLNGESGKANTLWTGVDTSIGGIADLATGDTAVLKSGLAQFTQTIGEASKEFRPQTPGAIAPRLADALAMVRALAAKVAASDLADPGKRDVLFELHVKERQVERALALALNVSIDAIVAPASESFFGGPQPTFLTATPGQEFAVRFRVNNLGDDAVMVEHVTVNSSFGEDWNVRAEGAAGGALAARSELRTNFKVKVPPHATLTRPYFSRPDEEQPYYNLDDPRWQGLSTAPYPLEAMAQVVYKGQSFVLREYVNSIHRTEPLGVAADPLIVGPALSVSLASRAGAVPLEGKSFHLTCTLRSNVKGAANGTLRLQLPNGWSSIPEELPFSLQHDGDGQTVTFEIFPQNIQAKAYEIRAVANYNGHSYEEGYRMVGYPGAREYPFYQPATYKAVGVNVQVAPGLRIGFVPGTGDDVPVALHELGVPVQTIAPGELAIVNFADFDAVILGVRAYATRPELRAANDRLLRYVNDGGTLLVQYNTAEFDNSGPYPFSLGPNAAKVVDENDPVRLETNPLFQWPNQITEHDFDGWQEERGHGFLKSWDPRYTALTETHDPEQPPQKGGLLVARYGKGIYIYDAFALYRQVPAGVPGAYRILANLVSAGKNPNYR